jgi:hypothetical protein
MMMTDEQPEVQDVQDAEFEEESNKTVRHGADNADMPIEYDEPEEFERQAEEDVTDLAPAATPATISPLPSEGEMRTMERIAGHYQNLVGTDLVPDHLTSGEEILAVMMRARDLGVTPSWGMDNLYVVNGKPMLSARGMQALLLRSGRVTIDVGEVSAQKAEVTLTRTDNGSTYTSVFTREDAQRAELLGKAVWQKYTPHMLFARAISQGAVRIAPDIIGGLYTPEELEVPVTYDEDAGEVVVDADAVELSSPPAGRQRPSGGDGQSGSGHSDQGAPICEKCGSEMRRRDGKNGQFWGCSGYPKCKFTMDIDEAEAKMADDEDPFGDDEDHNPYDERSYDNGGSENRLAEQDGRPPDAFDPTQWQIESFEHFNTAVAAMEWPDADRKALYQAACNRLWGKPSDPSTLKPDQLKQVFVKMVEIDEEEAEVA